MTSLFIPLHLGDRLILMKCPLLNISQIFSQRICLSCYLDLNSVNHFMHCFLKKSTLIITERGYTNILENSQAPLKNAKHIHQYIRSLSLAGKQEVPGLGTKTQHLLLSQTIIFNP